MAAVRRVLQLGAIALVLSLLGLLGWKLLVEERGRSLVAAVREGRTPSAPLFALPVIWPETATWPPSLRPTVRDGEVALAELRGRPVVLNFWASWCVPCQREAPILAASAEAHRGRVVFVGIDVQDVRSDARRFLRRYRANYVSVRDGDNSTYREYGLTGVPETFYLDRRGRIVAHTIGELSRGELEDGIAAALGPIRT